MIGLIKIDCTESTVKSPLAFFENFIKASKLNDSQASYLSQLPNNDDEDDRWNSFPYDFNPIDNSFTVEYSERDYNPDNGECKEIINLVKYSFTGELEKLFREQFYISTTLLKQKIDFSAAKGSSKKSIKEYLSDKRLFLSNTIDLIDSSSYPEPLKQTYKRPYTSLVVYCYRNFAELMPSQSSDSRIGHLLKNSEKGVDLYERRQLSIEIIDKILELTKPYSYGSLLFPFANKEQTKTQLLHFFHGNFHLIAPPVHFEQNLMAANYVIASFALYLGYNRRYLERKNIFKLGSGKFVADLCDRDYNRLVIRDPELTSIIDSMFSSCLS